MGEAKQRLEAVRAEFLKELDKWSFPQSDWETKTVEELKALPVVTVVRYPDDHLEWMRMKPRECHVNARFMQDNDPKGLIKQVTGWWVQGPHYVLHSVIDQYGDYACVTPTPFINENPFKFIPDAKIEWREQGDYRVAFREGIKVGPGVRSDPATSLQNVEEMRQRLLSGMNPYKAMQM